MQKKFLDRHIHIFFQIYKQNAAPLDFLLSKYFRTHKNLGAKDRKFIGNTIYQIVRFQSFVDFFSPEDPIQFIQSIDWEKALLDPSIPAYAKLGMSPYFYDKLCSSIGKEKTEFLGSFLNEQAPITIRINPLKTSREAFLQHLSKKFTVTPCLNTEHGISFHKREALFSLPEFKEGFFEMQDEGSQLIANQILANPGDLILDYCSGSGGKTLAFAHRLKGKGQIFLHDIRMKALQEAKVRLKRAGIQNAQCINPEHSQLKKLLGKCDWVLIDVPCSGTGTYRRNPDQKWRFNQKVLDELKKVQRMIAEKAVRYLKPNGRLVYATCSILPEENEDQVKFFLKTLPLSLEGSMTTLFPQPNGHDGFFYASFRKKSI